MVSKPSIANILVQFKENNGDEWAKVFDEDLIKIGGEEILASFAVHGKIDGRRTNNKASMFCAVIDENMTKFGYEEIVTTFVTSHGEINGESIINKASMFCENCKKRGNKGGRTGGGGSSRRGVH